MWVNKHLAQRPFSHYTAPSQKFDFDSAKIQELLLDFEAMAYKLDGFSQYSKMVYTKRKIYPYSKAAPSWNAAINFFPGWESLERQREQARACIKLALTSSFFNVMERKYTPCPVFICNQTLTDS